MSLPPDEEAGLRATHWNIQPGDIVLDIGCHVGNYTIPAAQAGAQVYAIDARIEAITELRHHATTLNVADRITTIHIGIGEPYPPQLQRAIQSHPTASLMAPTHCDWTTIDTLATHLELDRLDWLKIDIEGAELQAIQGATHTLKRFHPNVLIEDHTRLYAWTQEQHTTKGLLTTLAAIGYEPYTLAHAHIDYVAASKESQRP